MADWFGEAMERLPELKNRIGFEWIGSPMSLWHEVFSVFENAYEPPRNDDLIRRIYQFANWCLVQERSEDAAQDLLTCVAFCFFEHIPTNPAARADMPRWFNRDEILSMRQTFGYFFSPSEFEKLLELFGPPQSSRKAKKQKAKKAQ